ncbi:dienelactone hydrolase family protein [Pseudozobellia sp. WGM2]|uniref:dienelactone hydrolase family protein n=1 Tax=Pseudozobellia sp. WGM2 TaxID=2787625 RepID=UPI001AE04C58|nr:dienelactone hydrolase family protein [Pseudozobellia sp. WGM2]
MRIGQLNRTFYLLATFFLSVSVILNFCLSIALTQGGIITKYLESYPIWLLTSGAIYFTGLFCLVFYYFHKKYYVAFLATILLGLASFWFLVVNYFMLTEQRLEGRFISAYIIVLLSFLLFGISLLFSKAREKYWLKVAGIFIFLIGIALTITFIWSLNLKDFDLRRSLDEVHGIILVFLWLTPLPFILNFNDELKDVEEQKIGPSPILKISLLFIAILVFIPTINLLHDYSSNNLRNKTPSEWQKKLASPFEPHIFIDSTGAKLPYRLLKPKNYNPDQAYPLAVCLHHGGGNGTENIIQIATSELAQTLSEPKNREKYPTFIFVPQAPPGSSFGGIPNYPKIDGLVLGAIAELEQKYKIDAKRRYVMGVSLGGFGSWHLAGTRPDLFAAAIPICGGGNPEHAKNMANIPVWAFHGEEDSNVPVQLSRDMIEGMRQVGGRPKYFEFEGVGHDVWRKVDETPGKLEWLFSQKKD